MGKTSKKGEPPSKSLAKSPTTRPSPQTDFDKILWLIDAARSRAVAAVNSTLIELYWTIGEHISQKIADDGWGKGTVQELARYIQQRIPNARGFSDRNLWRMMQFYENASQNCHHW